MLKCGKKKGGKKESNEERRINYHVSLFLEFSPSFYLHFLILISSFIRFRFVSRVPLLKRFMLQQKRKLPLICFSFTTLACSFISFHFFTRAYVRLISRLGFKGPSQ